VPTVSYTVAYSQGSAGGVNGSITLNGTETRTANGRLDDVNNTVFADGFVSIPGYEVTIECTRTASDRMRVHITFTSVSLDPYDYCATVEKVVNDVPLSAP
jgi:hypothetical protein